MLLVRTSHEIRGDAGCRSPRRISGALLTLANMLCPGMGRSRSCIRSRGPASAVEVLHPFWGVQLCGGDRGDGVRAGPGRDWIPSRDPGVAPLGAWR